MSVFGVKAMALNMLAEWRRAMETPQPRSGQVQANRSWHKPPSGWVKINVDAACTLGQGVIGVSCVVRDDAGHFVRARSNVMRGSFHPRVAEALSLKEALYWTKEWRTSKFIFESNAKLLVEAVQGTRGTSYFDTIAENCSELLKHFDEVLLVFNHRSANQVARVLARAACSMSGLQEWISTAPDLIACNLAFDDI
ncbi:uncharacterized protein LOC141700627 [Apium graveolens]|uniref:uncharacterized protein LOC141700627 n=1 Tax=Apium graveolens TaxID=4045 RepID=UPI003D7975A1